MVEASGLRSTEATITVEDINVGDGSVYGKNVNRDYLNIVAIPALHKAMN